MIEFHLDGHSKVATYMQLVQQVKQSLRTGLLGPGDQLPKVRDVAESLAINPNTVLKAYRELEIEGLVEGRPGVGTFVTRHARRAVAREPGRAAARPGGVAAQGARRRPRAARTSSRWSRRRCGPRFNNRKPKPTEARRRTGDSMSDTAVETTGLGKRYGRTWALRDCSLQLPAGRIAALVGPNGAGKSTLLHLVGRAAAAVGGHGTRVRRRRRQRDVLDRDRLRRAGHPAVPRLHRRPSWSRWAAGSTAAWDVAPGEATGSRQLGDRRSTAGRQAVRRPAGTGRADARAGQAAAAAAARRAGREPGSVGPAGVPAGADGQRRRRGHHGAAVVAPARRPGTGLRLPDRAQRTAGCRCSAASTSWSPSTGC